MLETWRLQRISKKWKQTLSSDEVIRHTLNRWFKPPNDFYGQDDATVSPRQRDRKRLRYFQAVHLGAPFSCASFEGEVEMAVQYPRHRLLPTYALSGGVVAYISYELGGGRAVQRLCLRTGEKTTFYGWARERLKYIALSEACLAFVTCDGYAFRSPC